MKSSKQLILFMGVTGTKMNKSVNALLEPKSFIVFFFNCMLLPIRKCIAVFELGCLNF